MRCYVNSLVGWYGLDRVYDSIELRLQCQPDGNDGGPSKCVCHWLPTIAKARAMSATTVIVPASVRDSCK
jgi:hypothetical protein